MLFHEGLLLLDPCHCLLAGAAGARYLALTDRLF
jgi:hypothetical protein